MFQKKNSLINKKVIIVELKNSTGEFYTLIPILKKIQNIEDDLKVYFIILNPKLLTTLKADSVFYKILLDSGKLITSDSEAKQFIVNNRRNEAIIFSCYVGSKKYAKYAKKIIIKSKLILFPHAYAPSCIDTSKFNNDLELLIEHEYDLEKATYKFRYCDYLLVNSDHEIDYWQKKTSLTQDRIITIGALGYEKDWLNYLKSVSNENIEFQEQVQKIKKLNFKCKVLITTRHVHKWFLTPENSEYMQSAIFELIKTRQDTLFIFKIHPRQLDRIDYLKSIQSLKLKNVIFSDFNSILLIELTDLVISFWSSVILDAAAIGTKVIEFHRHHTPHSQIYFSKKNNKYISFYTLIDISEACDTKEQLFEAVEKSLIDASYKKNNKNLIEYFNLYSNNFENFWKNIQFINSNLKSITSILHIFDMYITNPIKFYIRNVFRSSD